MMFRRCAVGVVVALSLAYPQAEYVYFDVELVPVERIIQNLERRAKQDAADVESRFNLARAYGMAFALKADTVPVVKGGEPREVWFGHAPAHVPFATVSSKGQVAPHVARSYLAKAIARYREVIALDPKHLAARLGLAWCLQQSGERSQAIDGYRRVIREAWTREQGLLTAFVGWHSITVEAGRYLLPLLDPVRDQVEIATIRRQSDQMGAVARAITPIVIPLREGVTADDLVDPAARVLFDADGSGWKKRWTWTTRDAGWLVYLSRPEAPVTSALQMFGSVTFWMFWDNGYHALRALDDDGDGILRGAELTGLALWDDVNANARTDPGEVKSLAAYGIVSLATAHQRVPRPSTIAAFSPIGAVFVDGHTRATYDIVLHHARWETTH